MNIHRITTTLGIATAGAALIVFGAGASAATSATLDVAVVQHGQSGGGHDSQDHDTHDGGTDHQDRGAQGQGRGQTRQPGESSEGRGRRSLEDIFRDIGGEEEDSDRPDWAGGGGGSNDRGGKPDGAGSARGDLYGDMYVILRDENGVPVLNEDGYVQPVDADGNPIPLDEEGAPVDPSLALEVELGRLNIGRSPSHVLDARAEEVIALLNGATALETDAAGRLVVTSADGSVKTIDAPLENLAIYVALMTQGTIPGVTDLPGTEFDHLVDGTLTEADRVSAVAFLAGAADKFSPLSLDAVAYINAILGLDTETQGSVTWSDIDYGSYSYDRSDTYGDVTATVLVRQPDGSLVPTEVNIFEAVFGGTDYSGTAFASFAQAVDDARAVVTYIHEYEVPEEAPRAGE